MMIVTLFFFVVIWFPKLTILYRNLNRKRNERAKYKKKGFQKVNKIKMVASDKLEKCTLNPNGFTSDDEPLTDPKILIGYGLLLFLRHLKSSLTQILTQHCSVLHTQDIKGFKRVKANNPLLMHKCHSNMKTKDLE